jgi:hypothetical protein
MSRCGDIGVGMSAVLHRRDACASMEVHVDIERVAHALDRIDDVRRRVDTSRSRAPPRP